MSFENPFNNSKAAKKSIFEKLNRRPRVERNLSAAMLAAIQKERLGSTLGDKIKKTEAVFVRDLEKELLAEAGEVGAQSVKEKIDAFLDSCEIEANSIIECRIRDFNLKHLPASIANLKKLSVIDLCGNNFDEAEKKRIKAILGKNNPKIKIFFIKSE